MKINKIFLPIVLALILVAGIYIGKHLNKYPKYNYGVVHPQQDKISSVLNYIENKYVDTIYKDDLVEAAIPAIMEKLDPHSIYIPAKDMQEVSENMSGNFEGIGITFNKKNDTVVVINTIQGGPSEIVGILPGDRLVKVDTTIIAGVDMPSNDIIGLLKGLRGTKVKVFVKRAKEPELLEFEIIRDKIPIYSVDVGYMITNEIGYIKISRFAQTTFEEYIDKVKSLHEQNVKKLIIDLRSNTGGYMSGATNIANQFLSDGELIVYTEGKSSPRQEYKATKGGICSDLDVMIMLDDWSASASEILAGAIQDNDRGIIVGRRSFGKGLVQDQRSLPDGSAIRVTIARYYTPTGRSIQKPYGDNRDDYYNDLTERYLHGEFTYADSIQFADSLKFKTPGGSIVYGGGGIMPDIFIPIDTVGISKYYIRINSRGLIYRFCFEYSDKHRNVLNSFETVKELDNYLKTQNILNEFIAYAETQGVSKNPDGISESKEIIYTRLRASIARNFFDNDGFYPIIKEIDNPLNKAVEIFNSENI